MKYLLAFVLGCALVLSLGFLFQVKPAVVEHRILLDVDLRKAQPQIDELGNQGFRLVFVTREDRRDSATLYFQRER